MEACNIFLLSLTRQWFAFTLSVRHHHFDYANKQEGKLPKMWTYFISSITCIDPPATEKYNDISSDGTHDTYGTAEQLLLF